MPLDRPARRCWVVLLIAVAFNSSAVSDEVALSPDHHPWGHFPANSWKLVRTTAEAFDDKGHVVSVTITDTKTTLVAADDSTYTLRTDATVDVASRRIIAAPQTARYGYYGETPGRLLTAKQTGEATLTIDGRAIPCQVRQIVFSGDSGKFVSTLHYSDQFSPFVLRRETSMDGVPEEKRNSTIVEVIALDLPQRVRGELKTASYVKTSQRLPHGSKVTLEVHCDEIPGGVVAHWASETDAGGHVIRRSTLELLDYSVPAPAGSVQPGTAAPGVFRRPIRPGKAARRMD
jgi:hypothetical protein